MRKPESGGSQWSSFDEFVDDALQGNLPYGKWIDHVTTWLSYLEGEGSQKVLLLGYEDLCNDLPACLLKICQHLNLSLKAEDIDFVAPSLSFESMSKDRSKYEPISVKWKDGYNFLRRGVVNDSHSAFFDSSSTGSSEPEPTNLGRMYQAAMNEELESVKQSYSPSVFERVSSLSL